MAEKEPYNAGDEVQVKARKRKSEIKRERDLNDLKSVLDTPGGRRFVWRLLSDSGIYRSSFNTNALAMAHAEGSRNVGLKLNAEVIEASPANYLLMQSEASTQKEQDNA